MPFDAVPQTVLGRIRGPLAPVHPVYDRRPRLYFRHIARRRGGGCHIIGEKKENVGMMISQDSQKGMPVAWGPFSLTNGTFF